MGPETSAPLSAGSRLEGFEIESVLSDSGFGVVYLARDHALDLRVALKEYLPAALAVRGTGGQIELRDPSRGDAFERGRLAFIDEARILARCDHSSLLRVHRVWETNGTVYRLMPYYPGQSLLVARQGMDNAPDETSLRALLDAVLGALEALHSAGHIHGEVSPGNILLLPDDRFVLMDFGAVRRAISSDRIEYLMAALGASRTALSAESTGASQGPWTDIRALAAVAQFYSSGDLTALAPPPHGLQERASSLQYGAALLGTLDAMRAARPNDTLRSAAQFRALLQRDPAPASGRIEPVMNPVLPASAAALRTPDPGLAEVDFVADLSQAIAVTAHEAKMRLSATATRAPRSTAAAQAAAKPPRARVAYWGGTALVALAFGAAGWKLNEQMAANSVPGMFAGMASQDMREGAAPAGAPADRVVATAEVRQSPSIPPLGTQTTTSATRLADTPKEAAAPAAALDAATGTVVTTSAGATERLAAAERGSADKPALRTRPVARASGSPRDECGARTEFALYRCMQMECAQPRWATHAQCLRLRSRDEVD